MERLRNKTARPRRHRPAALLPAFILLLLSSCARDTAVVRRAPAAAGPWWASCTIGDTRIHYVDTGLCCCGSSILLVHGYLGSTGPFDDLIEGLSRYMRVVMPDLPAFGQSEVPSCACTMEYYLDFLERFCSHVGLDRFYIAGTSMGANIAAHYTVAHTEQIQGLVLISPFGLHNQDGRMAQIERWNNLLPLASSLVTKRAVERRLRGLIRNDERVTPEFVEGYWKPFTTPEGRKALVQVTRFIVGGVSMDGCLPRIEQPVLILVGTEDTLVSPEDCERFRALLAHEELEIIEQCGHFLYLDSPEVVSRKIVTFTRGGM